MESLIFPFEKYWSFYIGFTFFIIAMLVFDLGVFHRKTQEVSFRSAWTWSSVWISLAMLFCLVLYVYTSWKFTVTPGLAAVSGLTSGGQFGRQIALEFLTGFLIEKSLALDNIFVFYVVFQFFGVPARYQHRVLFYGILGALFFRVIFIAVGSILLKYHLLVVSFGLLLILTGVKLFFAPGDHAHLENNFAIRLLRRLIPMTESHTGSFFTRITGKLHATPLFVALVVVEISDIIFAVDSVPAIFAVTKEPLLVLTSNVFAILGLRAMYLLVARVVPRFYLLKYGLALILIFVGLKMAWLNEAFHGKFPIAWSLGIILAILALAIAASCLVQVKSKGRSASQ